MVLTSEYGGFYDTKCVLCAVTLCRHVVTSFYVILQTIAFFIILYLDACPVISK